MYTATVEAEVDLLSIDRDLLLGYIIETIEDDIGEVMGANEHDYKRLYLLLHSINGNAWLEEG